MISPNHDVAHAHAHAYPAQPGYAQPAYVAQPGVVVMGGKMGKHGKYKHGKHKGHKYKGHKYKGYKGKGFKKMGKKMKKIRGGRGVAVRGVAAGEGCGGAAKEDHGGIAVAAEVARGGDAVVEGVGGT
ncbi:hypothetical protein BBJ29_007771 [Phytophthora kernoviae]|uniref:Uncharacterized protein n=1 Tax=Phytophthora kernoviae TaxID=325452 RepID=A0A3R7GGM1_9STRA|nr:hypothetical protein BBJ29_007771 [Phytophthora kernoviae]